jgi:hypothetical protein
VPRACRREAVGKTASKRTARRRFEVLCLRLFRFPLARRASVAVLRQAFLAAVRELRAQRLSSISAAHSALAILEPDGDGTFHRNLFLASRCGRIIKGSDVIRVDQFAAVPFQARNLNKVWSVSSSRSNHSRLLGSPKTCKPESKGNQKITGQLRLPADGAQSRRRVHRTSSKIEGSPLGRFLYTDPDLPLCPRRPLWCMFLRSALSLRRSRAMERANAICLSRRSSRKSPE